MTPSSFAPERRTAISQILHEGLEEHQKPAITLRDLRDILGARGHGIFIVFLNLPNMIPAPIPGFSTIFGIPIALLGLQLLLGVHRPWLPKFLLEKNFDTKKIRAMVFKAEPVLHKLERFLHPRWFFLTNRYLWHLYGLAITLMALVMALPIVFGNLVLAIPITILALGMIARDGLFIITGLILGTGGLIFNLAIAGGLATAFGGALKYLFG
ncbi:MAG: exopolysaccharide biosynthesis protein [Dongiaceae bacterium]